MKKLLFILSLFASLLAYSQTAKIVLSGAGIKGGLDTLHGLVTSGATISIHQGSGLDPDTLVCTAGAGTVTTFSSGNLSPLFTTSVSNATTTPALSFSLSNAGANTVLGNVTGSSAAPSYGQIVNGQITNATIVASTKLSATGTPSATTFLSGNDTWSAPFTLTTTGSSGAATFSSGTLNIPQYAGSGGTITGTGSQQRLAIWNGANSLTYKDSLFYDTTNFRLGVGTITPTNTLHVKGSMRLENIATGVSGDSTLVIHGGVVKQYPFQLFDTTKAYRWTSATGHSWMINNLTTTIQEAATLIDTTLATSGVQVQNSPALYMLGTGWNSSGSASQTYGIKQYVIPTATAGNIGGTYMLDQYRNGARLGNLFNVTSAGVFSVATVTATTTNTFTVRNNGTNQVLTLQNLGYNSSGIGTGSVIIGGSSQTNTMTSGTYIGLQVAQNYNQSSSTAANTDLRINRFEQSSGSGAQYLFEAGTGSAAGGGTFTQKFGVDNSGNVTQQGNLTLGAAGNKITITEGTDGRLGQTTLVSGTKAVTINGLTTSSRAFVQMVSQGGTSTGVFEYKAVCTSNTLTITAIDVTGSTVTTDTSVLNYVVYN